MKKFARVVFAGVMLTMLAIAAAWMYRRMPEPKPASEKAPQFSAPETVARSPVDAPPGATITRQAFRTKDENHWLAYRITPAAPPAPGRMRIMEELAACQQSVSSRPFTPGDEPDNFIHITGRCLGHAFAFPARPGRACVVKFDDKRHLLVLNCIVDGTWVSTIGFEFVGFPNSTTIVIVPAPPL